MAQINLKKHNARRIANWASENERLFEFVTNNMELVAEKIADIYKKSWLLWTKEDKIKYQNSLFPEI